ncbi:hypothetical protein WMY93_014774 [Mugilogobius chulae]|uniref:Type II inositol 3,4-bisphosphate 4-phosphatase n=1 Tax=Mugilogobius chulae TaxID=88201 RepID=A0AAW0P215_9GOBI
MSSEVYKTYIWTGHKYFASWSFDLDLPPSASSPADGVTEVGEVKVSEVQMEAETDDKTTVTENKSLCDCLHGSFHDKENSPLMRAVLCCSVCKVYRFPAEDKRWLLVREQMSETPLSFSLPLQLLNMLVVYYRNREQEVRELRDLSPHLEELRCDIISRCDHMTRCYQETLAQLETLSATSSFKASSSRSERHLQFVPTNLHSQRMEVTSPDTAGVWYDVTTFGAPAEHHQGFKHGGLRRLMSKININSLVSYSEEERTRAKTLLENIARLQPLIFGLAEELLTLSLEANAGRLQKVLDVLVKQTEEFVHALKDDLVKAALLAQHKQTAARCVYICNGNVPGNSSTIQLRRASQGRLETSQVEPEYNEEEWLTAVTCAFILKLHNCLEDPDFLRQLHTVGILAQFEGLLSTYGDELGMLEDMEVGVAELRRVKFILTEGKSDQSEDLLPTLTGTWDNLVVNVQLPPENFSSLPQELREGHLIQMHPVFFNIGINQQQSLAERFGDSSLQEILNQESCEQLRAYCSQLQDKLPQTANTESLPELLSELNSCVETKKRKNVDVLWLASLVCRKVNGLRLTSCKSAKDRTAMSVTLEQCVLLKEKHGLDQQHFSAALDAMRREGCRLENVQKNIGCRRFAFRSVQLLVFPKHYKPPDGTVHLDQTVKCLYLDLTVTCLHLELTVTRLHLDLTVTCLRSSPGPDCDVSPEFTWT